MLRKLKAGMRIGMLEQKRVFLPKPVAHFGAEAFVYDAAHTAFHGGPQGMSPPLQHFRLQAVPPLTDQRSAAGPSLDPAALIGGQAVFPPLMHTAQIHPVKLPAASGMSAMESIRLLHRVSRHAHWVQR